MSRPHRVEYPGAVYHITSRGNAREKIYTNEGDRVLFLKVLGETVGRYGWICHAYCLMDNHYHLLVETRLPNLSQGMRQLNGLYTAGFNRSHRRTGHVFQGRFKAVLVEKQTHLLELGRYIALNPVRAGLANRPEAWKWCSYAATVGKRASPPFLSTAWLLGQFGEEHGRAVRAYRRFVLEGMGMKESPLEGVKGQMYLGSNEFARKWGGGGSENPKVQRRPVIRSLARLMANGGNAGEIEAAVREGYKLVEIAEHLGVHYTTVSQRLRRAKKAET